MFQEWDESDCLLSDDLICEVTAQVMTRDDELCGWVTMGTTGQLSLVGLRKLVRRSSEDLRQEYLIHGRQLSDKMVVLNCILRKDIQYIKANPTFHHWTMGEKRFGLTFQTSAEAKAFDRGIKRAIEDLMTECSPESTQDLGDDEVFMTVDLPPLSRKDSSPSASTTSTTTSSPTPQSPAISIQEYNGHNTSHHLHRIQPPSRATHSNFETESIRIKADNLPAYRSKFNDKIEMGHIDNDPVERDPYVQLDKNRTNEYTYPALDTINSKSRRSSLGTTCSQPPLPVRKKKPDHHRTPKLGGDTLQSHYLLQSQKRTRCVYCGQMFSPCENDRGGTCSEAPDKVQKCIEYVSCTCCARGMLYHCMADADGDYGHPCVCDHADDSNCKKWTALTVLSFFVPCLWCYVPLTACHKCGVACGCCGGRHKAA